MSVFKVDKNKDYTIMSNYHLRDKELSLKAKGLLSFMLSLPEDWDYSLNGLVAICKENTKAIRSALKELEENNYLIRRRVRDEHGLFSYEYTIYEQPYYQKGHAVERHAEKELQINTNIQNTKEQIDKIDKPSKERNHNIFSIELLNKGYLTKEDYLDYYDSLFDSYLNAGYSYEQLYGAIHYIVPRVISNNFKDEDGNPIENKFGYFKAALEFNFYKLESLDKDLYSEEFQR